MVHCQNGLQIWEEISVSTQLCTQMGLYTCGEQNMAYTICMRLLQSKLVKPYYCMCTAQHARLFPEGSCQKQKSNEKSSLGKPKASIQYRHPKLYPGCEGFAVKMGIYDQNLGIGVWVLKKKRMNKINAKHGVNLWRKWNVNYTKRTVCM